MIMIACDDLGPMFKIKIKWLEKTSLDGLLQKLLKISRDLKNTWNIFVQTDDAMHWYKSHFVTHFVREVLCVYTGNIL